MADPQTDAPAKTPDAPKEVQAHTDANAAASNKSMDDIHTAISGPAAPKDGTTPEADATKSAADGTKPAADGTKAPTDATAAKTDASEGVVDKLGDFAADLWTKTDKAFDSWASTATTASLRVSVTFFQTISPTYNL